MVVESTLGKPGKPSNSVLVGVVAGALAFEMALIGFVGLAG